MGASQQSATSSACGGSRDGTGGVKLLAVRNRKLAEGEGSGGSRMEFLASITSGPVSPHAVGDDKANTEEGLEEAQAESEAPRERRRRRKVDSEGFAGMGGYYINDGEVAAKEKTADGAAATNVFSSFSHCLCTLGKCTY